MAKAMLIKKPLSFAWQGGQSHNGNQFLRPWILPRFSFGTWSCDLECCRHCIHNNAEQVLFGSGCDTYSPDIHCQRRTPRAMHTLSGFICVFHISPYSVTFRKIKAMELKLACYSFLKNKNWMLFETIRPLDLKACLKCNIYEEVVLLLTTPRNFVNVSDSPWWFLLQVEWYEHTLWHSVAFYN